MSLSACFDAVYPSPSGERNLETLRTAASRLRRNPRVEWAIERITAEAKGGTKLERLKTRERARFADQVLRECARRAGYLSPREAAQEARRQLKEQAWKTFSRAAVAIWRSHAPQPLSDAEKVAIIFRHFAPPIVPPHLLTPPFPSANPDRRLAELQAHVRNQQCALAAERTATFKPESAEPEPDQIGPQPGCFPQPLPPTDDTSEPITALRAIATVTAPQPAGRWELRRIPGCFPAAFRRIWIPANEGAGESDEQ